MFLEISNQKTCTCFVAFLGQHNIKYLKMIRKHDLCLYDRCQIHDLWITTSLVLVFEPLEYKMRLQGNMIISVVLKTVLHLTLA